MSNPNATLSLPPNPESLTESLRGMGYTLPTAVSDVIDNSISANARNIWISLSRTDETSDAKLTILDDGVGMTRDELINAMRLGSVSPLERRKVNDLGRFGLGLKTASFSQCRCLKVISKKNGELSAFYWDLDYLANSQNWDLIEATDVDQNLIKTSSGTMVIWEKIDRVPAMLQNSDNREWADLRKRLENHLSVTFHRFIEDGDIDIFLDDRMVKPYDPFFSLDPAKPTDRSEQTWPKGSLKPKARSRIFILPLTADQSRQVSLVGSEDELNQQGFYLYRGKRLITIGGWLGFQRFQKSPEFRLARIRLDFDNDGDSDWTVDIKKCTARPPASMRDWLKEQALIATQLSKDYLAKASQSAETSTKKSGIWIKASRGQAVRIDRNNLIISTLYSALQSGELNETLLSGYLELIALSHPVAIKAGQANIPTESAYHALVFVFKTLVSHCGREKAIAILKEDEPFKRWQNLINEITGESQ